MARSAPPPHDALPTGAWRTDVLVRFSHCDPAGIVYFARYFDMLNGVVEDWFSVALGLDYHAFIRDRRVGLGYAHAGIDYARPGRMGEILTFAPLVERVGGASLTLSVPAHAGRAGVLGARLVIATTDLDRHRSIPLPDDLRAAVMAYQEHCR
jgi:4-hydroxybenzoyl-CoA thioesterase